MSDRRGASVLRALFREALGARLAGEGWVVDERVGDDEGILAALRKPLHGDFDATAEVSRGLGIPDRPPVRLTYVSVGVGYEPLRCLSWLLGEREMRNALSEVAADFGGPSDHAFLEIADEGDVPRVVEIVAAVVGDHGAAFAEPYASVDALLDDLQGERRVSLLAAAGRLEQARTELAAYVPGPEYAYDRGEHARFVRQLTRWLDSGADPALLPEGPPASRFARSEPFSARGLWHEAQMRKEAVRQARRDESSLSRDQLRSRLHSELSQRDVSMSPLSVETNLDRMLASPGERRAQTGRALSSLARVGVGVIKALRGRSIPDLSLPEWLDPPARAAYRVPHSRDEWIAVQLDRGARQWLDRAHAALHTFNDTGTVQARRHLYRRATKRKAASSPRIRLAYPRDQSCEARSGDQASTTNGD